MYYALAARLRAVLERCWPGLILCAPDLLRCRSGLGLGFCRNLESLLHSADPFFLFASTRSSPKMHAPGTYTWELLLFEQFVVAHIALLCNYTGGSVLTIISVGQD